MIMNKTILKLLAIVLVLTVCTSCTNEPKDKIISSNVAISSNEIISSEEIALNKIAKKNGDYTVEDYRVLLTSSYVDIAEAFDVESEFSGERRVWGSTVAFPTMILNKNLALSSHYSRGLSDLPQELYMTGKLATPLEDFYIGMEIDEVELEKYTLRKSTWEAIDLIENGFNFNLGFDGDGNGNCTLNEISVFLEEDVSSIEDIDLNKISEKSGNYTLEDCKNILSSSYLDIATAFDVNLEVSGGMSNIGSTMSSPVKFLNNNLALWCGGEIEPSNTPGGLYIFGEFDSLLDDFYEGMGVDEVDKEKYTFRDHPWKIIDLIQNGVGFQLNFNTRYNDDINGICELTDVGVYLNEEVETINWKIPENN